MAELLIELFCEEIPAMMQKPAEIAYKDIFAKYFADNGIKYQSVDSYITPRRIVIHADGLPQQLPAKSTEIRGPKLGAPDAAINGFCRSNNIGKDQLEIKEIKDQQYYVYLHEEKAQNIKNLLTETLSKPISSYVWPKSMYWGEYKIKWVRPLRNILCLFDGDIVPFEYGHLQANNITYGHRFMSNGALKINNFNNYRQQLAENYVVLDRQERMQIISNQLQQSVEKLGLNLTQDDLLLEEVTGLVEYPQILTGKIDNKFLAVPSEILVSSMRSHQKYFSLFDKEGNFAPYFLFVSNIKSGKQDLIIQGNEKVLSARLADALYFYNQDLKTTLQEQAKKLSKVTFHAKLGNLKDKTERLADICKYLSNDKSHVAKAALLCKSDIVSEVVGEFPELQGIMGYYYAISESIPKEVAIAIRDHYKPQGTNDSIPSNDAAILAIADKIDSLCGLIIAGEKPTGSKDPYGLRRQALGIIRIILANKLNINLNKLVDFASTNFTDQLTVTSQHKNQVLDFLAERVKSYFKNQYDISLIKSVLDFKVDDDLLLIELKLKSLKDFLNSKDGDDLLTSYKRARNIIADQKLSGSMSPSDFTSEYEHRLFDFINTNSSKVESSIEARKYDESLKILAGMRVIITDFFDNVMVKDKDSNIASNRMLLLAKLCKLFNKIAKFELL